MKKSGKQRVLARLLTLFIKPKKQRAAHPRGTTKGEHHDLEEIARILNEKYFENQIDLPLCWFGNRDFKPRSRIVLGSYHPEKKVIRVHRVLDKATVPHHVVSFIVYHEMLHHIHPPKRQKNKRRKIHHAQFLEQEKIFVDYARAQEGIKELLQGLWLRDKKTQGDKKTNKRDQGAEKIDRVEC